MPVWHPGITNEQSMKIEQIQKPSLSAILGKNYISYDNALKLSGLKCLSERREAICLKFICKNMESPNPLLEKMEKMHNTRSDQNLAKEFQCRSQNFFMSSLPFLARQYNSVLKTKYSVKRDTLIVIYFQVNLTCKHSDNETLDLK